MKNSPSSPFQEVWVLFFVLGVVMLNYPFIHIFNTDTLIFGFPILVLYFFVGWPLSIVVIYIFCRKLNKSDTAGPGEDKSEDQ